MGFGQAVGTDQFPDSHLVVNPFVHLGAGENHAFFQDQVFCFEIGMVKILDVMRLVAHQDVAPMMLHQLQRLTGLEIGLHDHPATREDRREHHLNGAADVKERLRTKKAIGFSQLQHLATAPGAAQHGAVKQHRRFWHCGGAGGKLEHRDIVACHFARGLK